MLDMKGVTKTLLRHGGELCDFRGLKNGGYLSKPVDSGKTFFDISVHTGQICMGFEAHTPGK